MSLESWIPVFVQLVIFAGTIYAIRSARPKQKAEADASIAEAANSLADAAKTISATSTGEVGKLQADLAAAVTEIAHLDQRLGLALEDKKRADAFVAVLDKKAAELSETVRRHSEHLVDLQQKFDEQDRTINALSAENSALRDEVRRLTEENATLRQRVAELEAKA
jgi:chromosome segregation ATPase